MPGAPTVRPPVTDVADVAAALFGPRASPATPRPAAAPAAAAPGASRSLTFHGRAGTLLGIFVVNVCLTLATLGLFYFWARVRVRRYLIGQTELDGDRFSYHGRGLEVLIGFAKAACLFGPPFFALQWLPGLLDLGTGATVAVSIGAYGVFLLLVPVARVGARRYRLSRSAWRGIRFSFQGRALAFVRVFASGWLLMAATLGLAYPVFATRNHAFLVRHSHFGSGRFAFDGRGTDLLVDYCYAVLLTLPTLGLAWFWFVARQRRYFWEHTSLGGLRFRSTVTGGRLLGLKAVNAALLVLTLGLAWPLTSVRNAAFTCRHLHLEGELDRDAIRQTPAAASATGEGLLSFLESDLDLG
jgi:uncharacterized membrane protein YjgN (DUF898 family)